MNLQSLVIHESSGGCVARPALCLFLYSREPVHTLGPSIVDAITLYLSYVGESVLKSYVGNNGEIRRFTKHRLDKDLKELRALPASLGASWIEYDTDPDGYAGEFGLLFYGTDFLKYDYERYSTNLLRLDFPFTYLEQVALDDFLTFVIELVERLPFDYGNVGFSFKRTSVTKQAATRAINALLPRFLAFDPCYQGIQDYLRDHTFTAHWLNFLGERLTVALGGYEVLVNRLAGADVRRLKNGTFIRSVQNPPIGDANRQAKDLGFIPEAARLLKPTRVKLRYMGDSHFDAERWLARFDEMAVGDFAGSR